MKSPPDTSLRPTSSEASGLDEIEETRTRLVRAQLEENEAIRKLGRFTEQARANKATHAKLLAEAKATRERAVAVYNELAKLLRTLELNAEGKRSNGR